MAWGVTNVCGNCGKAVMAWDEGNPYYVQKNGKKKYAYHPNHDLLDKCVGNDAPHLCLACGKEFMVDSRSRRTDCPDCGSSEICWTYRLEGKCCPFCKSGVFAVDPELNAIS